jgi:hypothetical protein
MLMCRNVNNPGPQGCEVRVRLFSRGHISRKIPPGITVTQYLGFTSLSYWESATHSLNPKYWVTSPSLYRYGLEKRGVASLIGATQFLNQAACIE